MQKIISLFQRNYDGDRLVRDEVVPGAEWVVAGEGVATRKWDGTYCIFMQGKLWKRHDCKLTKQATKRKTKGEQGPWADEDFKPAPEGWQAAQDEPDRVTGHWPGWLPVGHGPDDKWHRQARTKGLDYYGQPFVEGQTYKLCGPMVGQNNEGFIDHVLIPHGVEKIPNTPRTFDALKDYLLARNMIEGVVWHHPDGRMVKIKGLDFGIKRVRCGAVRK